QICRTSHASSSGSTTYYYVISVLSSNQSLNIYHATGNCQLHSWVNNYTDGKSDSAVYISPANRTIMLRDWAGSFLGFASVATNANVYWSSARCRSEERRVGKECRARWTKEPSKTKKKNRRGTNGS